ncbi:TPA: hypothetical protein JV334_002529 [Escherichia coli]|uniref:hypothetical protein n=1 Tax=Escherichia coli TaxID=562 RepID=UPI001BCEF474|nr:hypothetical protein [Escherichia coli]MBS4226665.1 hypothetical protein [Escherichia coli]MDO2021942.1 hypothetical protein [Escherichia coli]HAX3614099.1 hypothetical protein [Escherichia coli]HBB3827645.1 hypothetical protein [Escherichia coli]HCK0676866.1 hypothetical protein [Escherichia coli]
MAKSWFHHTECTTEQADELQRQYQRRGVAVKRSLNPDYLTWTISVERQEVKYLEPTPRTFRQKVWG